jgi:phosphate transport system substrate-binding protein
LDHVSASGKFFKPVLNTLNKMHFDKKTSCLAFFGLILLFPQLASAATLKINGSTTVNPPVAEAAEVLRAEKKLNIQVDTQGGSSGGISMLGEGLVQIGMSSKRISVEEKSRFPRCSYHQIMLGKDAVSLVVSKDVWDGGIQSISKEDMKKIYEKKLLNWSEIGGPNQPIAFFNKEPGRGTWEVFAAWLYGKAKNAPAVSFPEVGGNEEARNKVATTKGAISQLSHSWADGKRVFALGIKDEDGKIYQPTNQNIANGAFPLTRPLFLLTNGTPKDEAKIFVDFMLGERGQQIMKKHGYLMLAELGGEEKAASE